MVDQNQSSFTTSMTKYFKNFMLSGDLGFYCILCHEDCSSVAEAEKHLRWEVHRKKLKAQVCLPNFKSDCIFMIDKYFYCQFCNYATLDSTEIKVHIESDAHKTYKLTPKSTTTRVTAKLDGDCIALNNIRINQLQWQGIINKQCLFCNVSVTTNHILQQDHRVRQIQGIVNYVDDKYYRKIADKFQCFSCEKAYPLDKFDDHFMNHSNNNTIGSTEPVTGHNSKDDNLGYMDQKLIDSEDMDVILTQELDIQMLSDTKDQYFDINMELKQLECKTCKIVLKVVPKDITTHLLEKGENANENCEILNKIDKLFEKKYYVIKSDYGKNRSIAAQYGSLNFIKMNAGGSKGFCTLCDRFLSASVKIFKSHVKGTCHQWHLELKGINKPTKRDGGSFKTVPMFPLLKQLLYSAELKAFMLGGRFVISEDSFFLMKRIEHGPHFKKTKCFACDEVISPADEKDHCLSWKHKSNWLAAKYIDEISFIREIRPKLYHCCICNVSLPYWQSAYRHPTLWSHRTKLMESASDVESGYEFFKKIVLKTDRDKLYLQLMNAVFHTKYVIKT